jgi:GNAT superfamily N-acetyltransferase
MTLLPPPDARVERLRCVVDADRTALAALLIDAVEGGASVGFMHPLSRERAIRFWCRVAEGVDRGERALFATRDDAGRIVGTVQLLLDLPENQPHRAEIAKMLVHRSARRRGLGEALMRAAECYAQQLGRDLLTLDTGSADAERLYQRLGWMRVGEVPGFALWPGGGRCRTVFFYRRLGPG